MSYKTWKAVDKMKYFKFIICKYCGLKKHQEGLVQSGKKCKCIKDLK